MTDEGRDGTRSHSTWSSRTRSSCTSSPRRSSYPVPPSVRTQSSPCGRPRHRSVCRGGADDREGLTLVRNPHFRVWSPAAQPDGYVDRIEWTFGVPTEDQVDAVAAGDADLTFDAARSDQLDRLFVRFASRVHTSLNAQTQFLVLDTQSPPFDDPKVRRAMNLVIDRDRVVEILGGEGGFRPTCQQLPPNFPGYEPYCPFTSNQGRGERALVRPRRGHRGSPSDRSPFGDGRDARRVRVPPEYWPQGADSGGVPDRSAREDRIRRQREAPFPRSLLRSRERVPDGARRMERRLSGRLELHQRILHMRRRSPPRSGFCDRQIDEMVEEATRMQVDDPVAAGALWAEIDRAIVDQAPYVWLTNPNTIGFVSERVGNYQFSLHGASCLNQLWVR